MLVLETGDNYRLLLLPDVTTTKNSISFDIFLKHIASLSMPVFADQVVGARKVVAE